MGSEERDELDAAEEALAASEGEREVSAASEERSERDLAEEALAAAEGEMLCPICEGSGLDEAGECENCGGTGYVPEEAEEGPPDR